MVSIKKAYCDFLNTVDGAVAYRNFKKLLYAREDSLIQWLNPSIIQTLPIVQKAKIRICDIGGGDGGRITQIVRFITAKFKNRLSLDFIEQSKLYISQFSLTRVSPECRVKSHHALFENTVLPARRFDLVLLIHSIFAFESEVSIQKVLKLRSEHGYIIVVANAPNSFLGGLKRLTDSGYPDHRFEIDQVERMLRRIGLSYERKRTFTSWAINKKTWNRDIGIILTWISLGRYAQLSRRRKEEIADYIHRRGKRMGARTVFTEEEIVLIIPDR